MRCIFDTQKINAVDCTEDMSVIAEADDGDAAKALVAEHLPDVAVLDIQMPKATGIEVMRWIRKEHLEVLRFSSPKETEAWLSKLRDE